ncbi:MAG: DUF1559 domain-containing protein [Pirellulaceae bacterium]
MFFPAVQASRESARAISCRNNLRQLDLACRRFMDDRRRVPVEWTVELLPMLEETAILDSLKAGVPTARPAVFTCPSHTDYSEDGPSGGAALYRLMVSGKPSNPYVRFVDRSTVIFDSPLVPWSSEVSTPFELQPEGHGPHRGAYLQSPGVFLK